MRTTVLVIGAVNIVLKQLRDLPEGREATALRERALAYIEEVAMWSAQQPSAQAREATMKNVLALHIAVKRLLMDSLRVEDDVGLRLGTPL
jgi:hypothetical protein